VEKGRTFVIAARNAESAAPALSRAAQWVAPGDRVVLAHARRGALLELLGAGALRVASPDVPIAHFAGEEWLSALAAQAQVPAGVVVDAELLDGDPAAAIAALAARLGATAVIAAPARPGLLRGFAIGSTLLRLVREVHCPVVVLRADAAAPWRHVAAAVTPDPSGLRVVEAAAALAPGAALTLLHAWRVPDEGRLRMRGMHQAAVDAVREFTRNSADAALADLRRAAPAATTLMREGYAASVILEWGVEARPDALLIAAHRGAASEERWLGSVTQFVLYNWPGDLVLVP
jgi:nucleotide-binding universal stress UspA family protein